MEVWLVCPSAARLRSDREFAVGSPLRCCMLLCGLPAAVTLFALSIQGGDFLSKHFIRKREIVGWVSRAVSGRVHWTMPVSLLLSDSHFSPSCLQALEHLGPPWANSIAVCQYDGPTGLEWLTEHPS